MPLIDLAAAHTVLTDAEAPLWTRADHVADDYTVMLNEAQIAEVADATDAACRRLAGRDMTFDRTIATDDLPLPLLGSVLRDAAGQVTTGRGFAVLRGIPVHALSLLLTAGWEHGTPADHG